MNDYFDIASEKREKEVLESETNSGVTNLSKVETYNESISIDMQQYGLNKPTRVIIKGKILNNENKENS